MERVPVESQTLKSVGYNEKTRVLELEFTSGDIYQYFNVFPGEHAGLLAAESLGRYFQSNIRQRYAYRRISSAP